MCSICEIECVLPYRDLLNQIICHNTYLQHIDNSQKDASGIPVHRMLLVVIHSSFGYSYLQNIELVCQFIWSHYICFSPQNRTTVRVTLAKTGPLKLLDL